LAKKQQKAPQGKAREQFPLRIEINRRYSRLIFKGYATYATNAKAGTVPAFAPSFLCLGGLVNRNMVEFGNETNGFFKA